MKLKIDENLPIDVASLLNSLGHQAETVYSENLQGKPDLIIMNMCRQENRVLMTLDNDFSNIIAYPPGSYEGIIVVKVPEQSKTAVMKVISKCIPKLDMFESGQLWIVDQNRIRVRGMEQ